MKLPLTLLALLAATGAHCQDIRPVPDGIAPISGPMLPTVDRSAPEPVADYTPAYKLRWTWRAPPPGEYVYQALNLTDMGQTLWAMHHPGYYEDNPLYGRHPSDATIVGFKAGIGGAHLLVTEWLMSHGASRKQMWVYEILSSAIQGAVVGHNFSIGTGVRF